MDYLQEVKDYIATGYPAIPKGEKAQLCALVAIAERLEPEAKVETK